MKINKGLVGDIAFFLAMILLCLSLRYAHQIAAQKVIQDRGNYLKNIRK